MTTSYTIRIPMREMVEKAISQWPEYGVACYLDGKLKDLGLPHVGQFLSPDTFWDRIRLQYLCIIRTVDPAFQDLVFIFKLGDRHENS